MSRRERLVKRECFALGRIYNLKIFLKMHALKSFGDKEGTLTRTKRF